MWISKFFSALAKWCHFGRLKMLYLYVHNIAQLQPVFHIRVCMFDSSMSAYSRVQTLMHAVWNEHIVWPYYPYLLCFPWYWKYYSGTIRLKIDSYLGDNIEMFVVHLFWLAGFFLLIHEQILIFCSWCLGIRRITVHDDFNYTQNGGELRITWIEAFICRSLCTSSVCG